MPYMDSSLRNVIPADLMTAEMTDLKHFLILQVTNSIGMWNTRESALKFPQLKSALTKYIF